MGRTDWKRIAIESWTFIAVAVIAFAGGLAIGGLSSSSKTEVVHVSNASEGAEGTPGAATEEAEPESAEPGSGGAKVFASSGCGSCHTLAAAGSSGTTGPNLNQSLAPDDNTEGIEVMIAHPNAEVVEGYPPNVMPQTYGQQLSKAELHELAEYLVASTKAKPSP